MKTFKRIADNRGSWEMVYTGFVLILLSFFIMLCSFSTMEDAKVARFVRSFVNTLVVLPGGVKTEPSPVLIPPSPDIVHIKSELGKILQNIQTYTRKLGLEDEISFENTNKGLVMRVSDSVFFDLGEAKISTKGLPFLDNLLSVLTKTDHHVVIEGHADNLPIHTAKFPSNWELSTSRAVNVLRYFLEKGGLSAKRLSAVGCGEFRPILKNDTPEHRAKNRRVEIILTKPENTEETK